MTPIILIRLKENIMHKQSNNKSFPHIYFHHRVIDQEDMLYDKYKEEAITHVTHELIVMVQGLEHRNNPYIKTLDEYSHFQSVVLKWVTLQFDDIEAKGAKDAAEQLLPELLLYLSRMQWTLS